MITVILDDSNDEAKKLIEELRSKSYARVYTDEELDLEDSEELDLPEELHDGFLCRSVEEMDKILDETLIEIEEGKGMDSEEVFRRLQDGSLKNYIH